MKREKHKDLKIKKIGDENLCCKLPEKQYLLYYILPLKEGFH